MKINWSIILFSSIFSNSIKLNLISFLTERGGLTVNELGIDNIKLLSCLFKEMKAHAKTIVQSNVVHIVVNRCLHGSSNRPISAASSLRGSDQAKQDSYGQDRSQTKHSQGSDKFRPHFITAARCLLDPQSPAHPPVLLSLLQGSAPARLLVRCVMLYFREACIKIKQFITIIF